MALGFDAVVRTLQDYFDGFHNGDVALLREVFHPAAHLYSAADGALQDDPIEVVYARVRARPSPASQRQRRHDRILLLDRAGPEMVLAKVQLAIGPKLFTDYLALLRLDGHWRIIAKAYTYVPIEVETDEAPAG